jgi:hypothetical protein
MLTAAPPLASPSSFVRFEGVVERLRHVDRFLADHRIDDQIHLVRLHLLVDLLQLVHQIVVDLQAAGGVEDDCVAERSLRLGDGVATDADGVGRVAVDRDADLSPERAKLFDGAGALEVRRGQQRLAALRLQRQRQLRRGGRLAGPLQAAEHDDRGSVAALRQLVVHRPHQRDELLVDDLDDLFCRVDAGQHLLADGLGLDVGDELLHHVQVDVRLEEDGADLAEALADVVRREPAAALELLERGGEALGHPFEHDLESCMRERFSLRRGTAMVTGRQLERPSPQ